MCIRRMGTVCRKFGATVQLWRERWDDVMCVWRSLRPQAGPSETTWWYFRRMCLQGTMYPEPDGVPEVYSRLRWILVPPHTGSTLWLLPSSRVLAASLEITRNVPSYSQVFIFVMKLLQYSYDLGSERMVPRGPRSRWFRWLATMNSLQSFTFTDLFRVFKTAP